MGDHREAGHGNYAQDETTPADESTFLLPKDVGDVKSKILSTNFAALMAGLNGTLPRPL